MNRSSASPRRPSVLLAAGAMALLLAACSVIVPPEPGEPEYTNPIDPGSPDYVAPETTILTGPANGSTVATTAVTFTWSGNAGATLFQYRVSGGAFSGTWSAWSTTTTYTLPATYLDELAYTFEVRSGYPTDSGDPVEIDSTPATRSFTVNAIAGPALRLSPKATVTTTGTTFDIGVVAEEVTNLTMARVRIVYNPYYLDYQSYAQGTFLTTNGGSILEFPIYVDEGTGIIEINLGVAGASPPGVNGTGTIYTVRFQALSSGDHDIQIAASETELRDPDNQTIVLGALVGAKVIVP